MKTYKPHVARRNSFGRPKRQDQSRRKLRQPAPTRRSPNCCQTPHPREPPTNHVQTGSPSLQLRSRDLRSQTFLSAPVRPGRTQLTSLAPPHQAATSGSPSAFGAHENHGSAAPLHPQTGESPSKIETRGPTDTVPPLPSSTSETEPFSPSCRTALTTISDEATLPNDRENVGARRAADLSELGVTRHSGRGLACSAGCCPKCRVR